MNEDMILIKKFDVYLKEAACSLKIKEYSEAYKSIMKAVSENPNAPEPHNLLGIWYELQGNDDLARKHYRVAYVLNPLYKPASVNLERVSTLFLHKVIPVDYGEAVIEEEDEVKKGNERKPVSKGEKKAGL